MSRAVRTLPLALARLVEVTGLDAGHGSTAKRAASLAFIVRRRPDADEIRARVRFAGRIPARGLSGWQEEALEWLRMGDV